MNMPDSTPNLGKIAEDWVEHICATTFLADFTVRGPKYRKRGGQTKEAADLLVAFGDTLVIIQVKTKLVEQAATVLTEHDLKRTADTVGRAMQQFRAMVEAADDPGFFTFINARGHPLRFGKSDIKNAVAITVYGLVAPDGQFSHTNLRFTQSCFPEDGIPVHLFTMQELRLLTKLADTLPDFLNYLGVRAMLHLQGLVHPQTLPEDVWTLATFEPDRLLQAMKTNAKLDLVGITERHQEAMAVWEKAEEPSYFVDWLIQKLYEGVESPTEIDDELVAKTKMLARPGSVEAFQETIPFLAKLRRRDRNELAIGFAEKVECAKKDGMAFQVLKFEGHGEAFLVLAIDGSRKERQVALLNLARAAAYKIGVRHVVAIATAPISLGESDCDVMLVDAKDMKIDDRLVEAVNGFFGTPQKVIRLPTTSAVR
ncbi:MAG: hypothetical protein F9K30_16850 [Dechloromonas sp.]|nr:MAG: hypothetical protein F9K30_16850 [Dechloromonas sp.]